MATEGAENGQVSNPADFSWLEGHPLFCIILVGENVVAGDGVTPFGIQKDLLIAKSTYFREYFAEKREQKVEEVIQFPDINPVVFGLAQLFMFTGTINTAPQPLPGYDLLIAVWKLGDELGIEGLCEEALKVMAEYRATTQSIPAPELLVMAWKDTAEGSPIRALFLSWTAEYIRSSESRAEFTKTLPQEVLSELVVVMSHLNSAPIIQVKPASSPSVQQKNVHYLDHESEERGSKATKHRNSEALSNRVKKAASRSSLPTAPKPPKAKRASLGGDDERRYTEEQKLIFCADLMTRMLSGPGFWTRLVGPFKDPVRPVEDGVPDYFDKVKKPMDLGTIKSKMDRNEYATAAEFQADVHQIFKNCFTYWGKDADMSLSAERFKKSFDEKYVDMYKWLAKNLDGHETA